MSPQSFVACLSGFLVTAGVAHGQEGVVRQEDGPTSSSLVSLDASLAEGGLEARFVRRISDAWAIEAGISVGGYGEGIPSSPSASFSVGPAVGLRYFAFGQAPSGFWLGPELGFNVDWLRGSLERSTEANLSLSGLTGYTWVGPKGLTFEVALGVRAVGSDTLSQSSGFTVPASTVTHPLAFAVEPDARVGIGWAF
jgi:hypothetical protein